MEKGEFMFAKKLVANCMLHDNSKFFAIEWDNLVAENPDEKLLKEAIMQHNRTNNHHPEAWDKGIHGMPREALAEMLLDWKARSSEMGTDLREWVNETAAKRFGYTKDDQVYKTMMEFVNMLLLPPFKPVSEM